MVFKYSKAYVTMALSVFPFATGRCLHPLSLWVLEHVDVLPHRAFISVKKIANVLPPPHAYNLDLPFSIVKLLTHPKYSHLHQLHIIILPIALRVYLSYVPLNFNIPTLPLFRMFPPRQRKRRIWVARHIYPLSSIDWSCFLLSPAAQAFGLESIFGLTSFPVSWERWNADDWNEISHSLKLGLGQSNPRETCAINIRQTPSAKRGPVMLSNIDYIVSVAKCQPSRSVVQYSCQ